MKNNTSYVFSGYAFGLRIPLPAGNKFPYFPKTYEVSLYYN